MANEFKMVDDKLVQLTDEEQKEYEARDFSDESDWGIWRLNEISKRTSLEKVPPSELLGENPGDFLP